MVLAMDEHDPSAWGRAWREGVKNSEQTYTGDSVTIDEFEEGRGADGNLDDNLRAGGSERLRPTDEHRRPSSGIPPTILEASRNSEPATPVGTRDTTSDISPIRGVSPTSTLFTPGPTRTAESSRTPFDSTRDGYVPGSLVWAAFTGDAERVTDLLDWSDTGPYAFTEIEAAMRATGDETVLFNLRVSRIQSLEWIHGQGDLNIPIQWRNAIDKETRCEDRLKILQGFIAQGMPTGCDDVVDRERSRTQDSAGNLARVVSSHEATIQDIRGRNDALAEETRLQNALLTSLRDEFVALLVEHKSIEKSIAEYAASIGTDDDEGRSRIVQGKFEKSIEASERSINTSVSNAGLHDSTDQSRGSGGDTEADASDDLLGSMNRLHDRTLAQRNEARADRLQLQKEMDALVDKMTECQKQLGECESNRESIVGLLRENNGEMIRTKAELVESEALVVRFDSGFRAATSSTKRAKEELLALKTRSDARAGRAAEELKKLREEYIAFVDAYNLQESRISELEHELILSEQRNRVLRARVELPENDPRRQIIELGNYDQDDSGVIGEGDQHSFGSWKSARSSLRSGTSSSNPTLSDDRQSIDTGGSGFTPGRNPFN